MLPRQDTQSKQDGENLCMCKGSKDSISGCA
jgi:hypothetical protein